MADSRVEVCEAVVDFFKSGKILGSINSTVISIVPKVESPEKVTEFCPTACCNVLYKAITKIIADRLQMVSNELVGLKQAAFVIGKSIFDNIFIAHELLKHYGRQNISPRAIIKVDIMKAYDNLDWNFLCDVLRHFNFPDWFVGWVRTCISSTCFSIFVNGQPEGILMGVEVYNKVTRCPHIYLCFAWNSFVVCSGN